MERDFCTILMFFHNFCTGAQFSQVWLFLSVLAVILSHDSKASETDNAAKPITARRDAGDKH